MTLAENPFGTLLSAAVIIGYVAWVTIVVVFTIAFILGLLVAVL